MIRRLAAVFVLVLAAISVRPALGGADPEVAAEIARLRAQLAASGAQEQLCLAGATRPVWVAPVASDLKVLEARAREAGAAAPGSAEAETWRELERKARALEAHAVVDARSGADLLNAQQAGLGCLDRFAAEREALHASLELALADPAAYHESLRLARESGGLDRELSALHESALALAGAFRARARREALASDAAALRRQVETFRRRNMVALQSVENRELADPALRLAESLIATSDAWGREQQAARCAEDARSEQERHTALRDRDEAARMRRAYWTATERLLSEQTASSGPTR